MTKHKIENSAIFALEPKRALEVLSIMGMLSEIGKANFREARTNGINHDEWNNTQLLFLTSCSKNLCEIRETLEHKTYSHGRTNA